MATATWTEECIDCNCTTGYMLKQVKDKKKKDAITKDWLEFCKLHKGKLVCHKQRYHTFCVHMLCCLSEISFNKK